MEQTLEAPTTTTTTEPEAAAPADEPSFLSDWLDDLAHLTQTAEQAIHRLRHHFAQVPSPQTEAETETLMQWRRKFGLLPQDEGLREKKEALLNHAAHSLAAPVVLAAAELEREAKRFFGLLESSLCVLAAKERAGLVAPDLLPPEVIQIIDGRVRVVMTHAQMVHSILWSLSDDEMTKEGPRQFAHVGFCRLVYRFDRAHQQPPRWITLSECRRRGIEARQLDAKQAEEASTSAKIHAERRKQEEEKQLSDKQRIKRLEKQLARMVGGDDDA